MTGGGWVVAMAVAVAALVTYPAVRYVLPDRISLEATTDVRTLDSVVTFLQRQHWLVKSVATE